MTFNHYISQKGIGWDFPSNFDHLATSLQIDNINGDCQDYQESETVAGVKTESVLINWAPELE